MEPQKKKCKLDHLEERSSTKIVPKPDKFNFGPFPEVFLRFPHLAEQIFNCLENKSLANCNLVSRSWQNFLEYHKILNVRIVLSVVEKYHTVQESWKKVLKLSKTEVIIDLRESVGKVYKYVPAKKTLTPYHILAMDGHLDSYKYVVSKFKEKNPVNDTGETPLHVAAFNGDLDMCKYIMNSVDNKSPKSNDGVTPLHFAARKGHLNVCKYIIEEIGEKVQIDNRKQTPLHWAAYGGNLDVFIYLLGFAEDKNPMCNYNAYHNCLTPLHIAATNGHLDIVQYLMNIVSEKSPRCNLGYTPLHAAAYSGHLKICQYIMENIEGQTGNNGETPLHLAAWKGHFNVCNYILENVHDKNPSMNTGETPLDLAHQKKHFKIFELISQHIEKSVSSSTPF